MRTLTAIERAKLAKYYFGLDLTKSFFELNDAELWCLELCKKTTGYNGRNELGRSKRRQFWYYLQWGWKKFQEKKGAQ